MLMKYIQCKIINAFIMRRVNLQWILMMLVVASLWNCSGQDCQCYGVSEMPEFEPKFPKKQVVVWNLKEEDGCDSIIEFSSFEEAEWKLIHYFFPNGELNYMSEDFDYNILSKVFMADPSSMEYPFDSICHYANVRLTDSDDGKVRFFTWEEPHFWTMSDYQYIVGYRWNDSVLFQIPKCPEDQEMCVWNLTEKIYTFKDGANAYYFTDDNFREWTSFYSQCLTANVLTCNGLDEVGLFVDDEGVRSCVSCEYDASYWYHTANHGEGFDWLNYFDESSNTIYVQNTFGYLDDRYYVYKWDGKYFTLVDSDAGSPFINPQLREYEKLVRVLETDRNKIRIDMMRDGSYRYVAWKKGATMLETPELVIGNGRLVDDSYYIFTNNGYEYHVDFSEVVVKKGNEIVGSWKVIDRFED